MPEDNNKKNTTNKIKAPTQPQPKSPPDDTTVELGESVRKGTHVMPELSLPQNFEPPSAAPSAGAPAADATPAEPATPSEPSGGSEGSPSAEK